MKCRYNHCKLGGEVEKEDAIYHNRMYFHDECYKKYEMKAKLRDILNSFPTREVNISISKAIDDNNYPLGFIEFVARNKKSEFKNSYGLLYQLKIEQNYKDYVQSEGQKIKTAINQAVQNMKIDEEVIEFDYKPTRSSRLNIY